VLATLYMIAMFYIISSLSSASSAAEDVLQSYVSFAECGFYGALLQKRPTLRRSLLHNLWHKMCYISAAGWLPLAGSFKSWFSCAKEAYKSDYILQKRRMILRSLLMVATPYGICGTHMYDVAHMQQCHICAAYVLHMYCICAT